MQSGNLFSSRQLDRDAAKSGAYQAKINYVEALRDNKLSVDKDENPLQIINLRLKEVVWAANINRVPQEYKQQAIALERNLFSTSPFRKVFTFDELDYPPEVIYKTLRLQFEKEIVEKKDEALIDCFKKYKSRMYELKNHREMTDTLMIKILMQIHQTCNKLAELTKKPIYTQEATFQIKKMLTDIRFNNMPKALSLKYENEKWVYQSPKTTAEKIYEIQQKLKDFEPKAESITLSYERGKVNSYAYKRFSPKLFNANQGVEEGRGSFVSSLSLRHC